MQVLISIGSNVDASRNVAEAVRLLSQLIDEVCISEIISTKPFGEHYKNEFCYCLMRGETSLPFIELEQQLKQMERSFGRTAASKQSGLVPLDLDILQYGSEKYHLHDWQRPYVADLLASVMLCNKKTIS